MHTEVTLVENNTSLTVFVNDDFTADGRNFGYIEIHDGRLDSKAVFWDNLGYFFKIGDKKKKSIKRDLKISKQFYPGVVSDIEKLIKKAFEVEILSRNTVGITIDANVDSLDTYEWYVTEVEVSDIEMFTDNFEKLFFSNEWKGNNLCMIQKGSVLSRVCSFTNVEEAKEQIEKFCEQKLKWKKLKGSVDYITKPCK